MEVTRKTDYALRMLSELVRAGEGAVLSVRRVAEDNDIPYSFARSIQHDLVQAGMVESSRGSRGGMTLKIDPHEVTIHDVIEAVQGPICVSSCNTAGEGGTPCERMPECHFNPLWVEAEDVLSGLFSTVTLWDVVMEHKVPQLSDKQHFAVVSRGGSGA